METFNLKIVTLDGTQYDGFVQSVVARTTSGDVCILKNHADYVAPIEIGKVKIKDENGEKCGACSGGFISVSGGEARIVATTFEFADDIDINRAKLARQKAENKLNTDRTSKIAEIKLKKALLRLEIAGGYQK